MERRLFAPRTKFILNVVGIPISLLLLIILNVRVIWTTFIFVCWLFLSFILSTCSQRSCTWDFCYIFLWLWCPTSCQISPIWPRISYYSGFQLSSPKRYARYEYYQYLRPEKQRRLFWSIWIKTLQARQWYIELIRIP